MCLIKGFTFEITPEEMGKLVVEIIVTANLLRSKPEFEKLEPGDLLQISLNVLDLVKKEESQRINLRKARLGEMRFLSGALPLLFSLAATLIALLK